MIKNSIKSMDAIGRQLLLAGFVYTLTSTAQIWLNAVFRLPRSPR